MTGVKHEIPGILGQPWKVYHKKLRPQFGPKIIEIQTLEGIPVIEWGGFDGLNIPKWLRLAIARHIVRIHNESLEDYDYPAD